MSDDDDYNPTVPELNGNSSSENEDVVQCMCSSDHFTCSLHRRRGRSRIWKYFQKTANGKRGICRICGKMLSYGSTISNLKVHIRRVHKKAYEELCKNGDANDTMEPAIVLLKDTSGQTYVMEEDNITSSNKKMDKQIDGVLSRWFESKNFRVRCRICMCLMSHPARATNLRMHLKFRHPPDYEKLQQLEKAITEQSNPLEVDIVADAENTEDDIKRDADGGGACADGGGGGGAAQHLADCSRASSSSSWDYFDNITLEAATCRLCQESVSWGTSVSELRHHLLQDHPDLATTLQDTDEISEHQKLSNDTNQLEEEYLDETLEDAEVEKMIRKMHSGDRYNKKNDSRKTRRSEEQGRKGLEEKFTVSDDEWGQTLDRFGLYVGTLMRMLPKRTALKFQVQIIDRLVRETMKSDI